MQAGHGNSAKGERLRAIYWSVDFGEAIKGIVNDRTSDDWFALHSGRDNRSWDPGVNEVWDSLLQARSRTRV